MFHLLEIPLLEGFIPALSRGFCGRQLCDPCRRALRGLLPASLRRIRHIQQSEPLAVWWLGHALLKAAACPMGCMHVLSHMTAKHMRPQNWPSRTRCMAGY